MNKTIVIPILAGIVGFGLGLAFRPFTIQQLNKASFARINRINGSTEIYQRQQGGRYNRVQQLAGWFGWTTEVVKTETKYSEKPTTANQDVWTELSQKTADLCQKGWARYTATVLLEEGYLTPDGRWTYKARKADSNKPKPKVEMQQLVNELFDVYLIRTLPDQIVEERLLELGADPNSFTLPKQGPHAIGTQHP